MRIVTIKPHQQLQPYVLSYRIVEDHQGEVAGTPIWTCPEPIGILSVNFGKPSYHESGALHPKVGLLGIQTYTRKWVSQSETGFVMIMLSIPGVMTLFPNIGLDSVDRLLDVSALWGDQAVEDFWRSIPYPSLSADIKNALDKYLLSLFNAIDISMGTRRISMYQTLIDNKRIDTVCKQLGINPKTLQREFKNHLGVSPKKLMSLHRLQHSIKSKIDLMPQITAQEYSDQAHEIREWRQHLNCTPGQYSLANRSAIAKVFDESGEQTDQDSTIFYL